MKIHSITILLALLVFISACSFDEFLGVVEEFGCGFTSGNTKDHCYKDSANRQGDVSVCDRVTGLGENKNAPKNQCYQDLAVQNNDVSFCDKIESPVAWSTTKEACMVAVGRTSVVSGAECNYDSDCSSVCENNVFWKRGCDIKTSKCIKTFDTVCAEKFSLGGEFKFPFVCKPSGCVKDEAAIRAEIKKVSDELKMLNIQSDNTNAVFLKANKNCINGLADVTNELIVSAAKDIGFPITSIADALTNYVEQGLKVALQNSFKEYNPKMPPDQWIILNCNLEKTMKETMVVIGKKQDELRLKLNDLKTALES
ncbi:MAG: hypothetical protein Q7K43_01365 [Candidatus Woesearchaeota archaeon]|nr:hypothetical protein [Candidatus Woesearchaeota archaeon]